MLTRIAAVVAFAAFAAPAFASDTVRVTEGTLQGATESAVTSFKNIPFAAPPVGPLRWRPPQPAKSWAGARDATRYGPMCTQMHEGHGGGNEQEGHGHGNVSEDCLQLNVWTPASFKPGQRLPVMVFLHGGSFKTGSATDPLFDGTHFAERGAVLVKVNYRLGRFGFFAHPALSAEQPGQPLANYGTMDVLAALAWVQKNVRAFGGDPANVTVFGVSAGAILINEMMASPKADGLFAKAISQSGFGGDPVLSMAGAEKLGLLYAQGLGIEGAGTHALRALRALSAAELSKAPGRVETIVDGTVLPESPMEAFAAARELNASYIAGGNSWEASIFPEAHHLELAGPFREKLIAAYGEGGNLKKIQWDIATEFHIIEPNRQLARLHIRNGHKAWVYYDSYVPAWRRDAVHGLGHGDELPYVFGTLPDTAYQDASTTVPAATPDDRKLSAAMMDAWTAFARTGDPSTPTAAWPTLGTADSVLEFGADGVAVRRHFHQTTLDLVQRFREALTGLDDNRKSETPTTAPTDDLATIAGLYHSEDLARAFVAKLSNGVLTLTSLNGPPVELTRGEKDTFLNNQVQLSLVRGSSGEVTGSQVALSIERRDPLFFFKKVASGWF
jgi:para-nitrobenzyl esterase